MQELFNYNRSSESTNPLSGHIILSPYMRVLYHTLKFIDEDYFEKEDEIFGRKKYTSLIRSLISNDILFLIAVNSSYIYKKGEYNQYSRYQQLLQKYDFFEHADFYSIKHDSDSDKNLLIKEQLKVTENQIGICFTNYINQEGINLMSELEFTLRQPEFIAYIYKNPRQKVVRSWFNLAPWKALEILSKRTENRDYKDIFVDRFLSEYIGRYMVYSTPAPYNRFNEESKTPITYTILKSIARAVKSGRIKQSETSILRFAQVNEESRYVEKYSRYESLYETVKDYNTFINRKNDILFGRRYEPLKLMVKKINCFEKTVLTQRYL
nr:putative phage abortive infection protein [Pantoea agglomerans]